MHTIIETDHFSALPKKLLSKTEYDGLIETLSRDPKVGDLMPGTGGFRKLRLARSGKGKSGGYRVVYFYYSSLNPIYLVSVYAKNQKENLSKAEQNALAALAETIKQSGK